MRAASLLLFHAPTPPLVAFIRRTALARAVASSSSGSACDLIGRRAIA
jgi:hypothetical protein